MRQIGVLAALCAACEIEPARAVEASTVLTADMLRTASGGVERGTDLLGMVDVLFDAALPAGFVLGDTKLHVHLQWTDGGGFTERRVGDVQTVSNIDSPDGGRVMELWLERAFGARHTLRFGLYDLNSEFDATEGGALFINSSHGVGPDLSQSGVNGPSIFPTTSLALRGEWRGESGGLVRAAVLDAVPGDPDAPGRTRIRLGDGALFVLEGDVYRDATRLGIGAWAYSRRQPRHSGEGRGREGGVYALAEHVFAPERDGGWRAFLRIGRANAGVEQLGLYAGLGVVREGGLAAGLDDQAGIAIGYARAGHAWRDALQLENLATTRHETALELTWRVQLTPAFAVQPDVQYVMNPGLDPTIDDALIIGARFEVTLSTRSD